ncbi:MAG: hypothetical protein Q8N99_01210 [Nanoarchaeota archaeon]|nr:hypothetical protein [Nanoarchaeota archaeon]
MGKKEYIMFFLSIVIIIFSFISISKSPCILPALKSAGLPLDFLGQEKEGITLLCYLFPISQKLTGYAPTDTGEINLTVETSANINFTTSNVNFGIGSVTSGTNATIDTLGNVINGNWSATTGGFILENIGNTNLSLAIKSDKTAGQFIGGTNPGFYYNMTEKEAGACPSQNISFGSWQNINTTGDGTLVCDRFLYEINKDSLKIDIRLVIPSDAYTGNRSCYITATATTV